MLKKRAAVSIKHCFAVLVLVAKSYLTLQPHKMTTDDSPLGSSVPGILQARKLEWAAMPCSRDLPDPGIQPMSLTASAFCITSAPGKPHMIQQFHLCIFI